MSVVCEFKKSPLVVVVVVLKKKKSSLCERVGVCVIVLAHTSAAASVSDSRASPKPRNDPDGEAAVW